MDDLPLEVKIKIIKKQAYPWGVTTSLMSTSSWWYGAIKEIILKKYYPEVDWYYFIQTCIAKHRLFTHNGSKTYCWKCDMDYQIHNGEYIQKAYSIAYNKQRYKDPRLPKPNPLILPLPKIHGSIQRRIQND